MISDFMLFVFWSSAAFLVYTFAGYPLLLSFVSFFKDSPHSRSAIEPSVSLIIAAHNEAAVISRKIVNCLELAYAAGKLEVLIASDGSTDRTVQIARLFGDRGVRVIEITERRGKQYAQLQARELSRGEILVFTDASVELGREALRNIVSNFADPSIGCVSSEDRILTDKAGGEQSYVQLEMWIRRRESAIGSTVSASGSFFAARRSVCDVWHTDLTSDFFVPLNAVSQGLRSVVDPKSVGHFGAVRSESDELNRKVRTIVNGIDVFFRHKCLLNPFRYGFFSWQLVSHKLFRWLITPAILVLLISNFFLLNRGTFYRISLVLQCAAVGTSFAALAARRVSTWKPVKVASYILLGNAATLMAWCYYLAGEKFVSWQPSQRS